VPTAHPERVFSLRELTRLLRLTPKRALQLRRLGLLHAETSGFQFRDLVACRVSAALLEAGATVRQVREALAGARRLAPQAETPLAEVRLLLEGQRIVVAQDQLRFDVRTGQALLDFPAL
jgi:DNA-binding transcriptional MerR regulator